MQTNQGGNTSAPAGDIGSEGKVGSLGNAIGDLQSAISSFATLKTELETSIDNISAQSLAIRQLFAGTEESTKNIRVAFADSVVELSKVGGSAKDVADLQLSVAKNLASNFILTKDTAIELFSASKILGTDADKLLSAYKNIGYGFYDVSKQAVDLVNYSRSLGLNASQVFATLNTNLERANTFSFTNGIEGITKMAAQSTLLKTDMGKVLDAAEKLFDPEEAIKMSAAFARLGGTVQELMDPNQLMYLSRYEPEKFGELLRQQASDLMRFNEATGKIEILDPALFREVAKNAGMSTVEFMKMGSAALEFNMKMSQINFAPGATEEQKQAIAAMSQLKDGKATIEVYDENLKKLVQKDASTLTPKEMDEIMKRQAEPAKSAVDLQKEANGYLKSLVDGLITERKGITYSAAATFSEQTPTLIDKLTKSVNEVLSQFDTKFGENRFDLYKKFTDEALDLDKVMRALGIGADQVIQKLRTITTQIGEFFNEESILNLQRRFEEALRNIANRTVSVQQPQTPESQVSNQPTTTIVQPNPFQPSTQETLSTFATITQKNIEEKNTTEQTKSSLDVSGNIVVSVNDGQFQTLLQDALKNETFINYFYDTIEQQKIKRKTFAGEGFG